MEDVQYVMSTDVVVRGAAEAAIGLAAFVWFTLRVRRGVWAVLGALGGLAIGAVMLAVTVSTVVQREPTLVGDQLVFREPGWVSVLFAHYAWFDSLRIAGLALVVLAAAIGRPGRTAAP